jgi:hypothetical protein
MTDKTNPKPRRCGSCALLDNEHHCPAAGESDAADEACDTDFVANDTCRIADALETIQPLLGLGYVQAMFGSAASIMRATGKVVPADRLEVFTEQVIGQADAGIKEALAGDDSPPAPDLSRLEQELRALATSAGAYRGMGDHAEADRAERKADVIRRCIAILKGEQEPLEVPK